MKHSYVSIADYHAPLKSANYLQGLGAAATLPPGRAYLSTAYFRAPYQNGYFQDNTLQGFTDDLKVALRQVPTWGYAIGAGVLGFVAYKAYKAGRKA